MGFDKSAFFGRSRKAPQPLELDGGQVLHFRVLSAGDRVELVEQYRTGDAPTPRQTLDFALALIVRSACEADGAPVFTEADLEALRAEDTALVDKLADAALRVNGMRTDDAAKNSDGGLSDASPSV